MHVHAHVSVLHAASSHATSSCFKCVRVPAPTCSFLYAHVCVCVHMHAPAYGRVFYASSLGTKKKLDWALARSWRGAGILRRSDARAAEADSETQARTH